MNGMMINMNRFEYDVDNIFTYHKPTEEQQVRYQAIRSNAKQTAELLLALCPESRERAVALTKLEEAIMWANASVARNE